jgi:hypothetical protein
MLSNTTPRRPRGRPHAYPRLLLSSSPRRICPHGQCRCLPVSIMRRSSHSYESPNKSLNLFRQRPAGHKLCWPRIYEAEEWSQRRDRRSRPLRPPYALPRTCYDRPYFPFAPLPRYSYNTNICRTHTPRLDKHHYYNPHTTSTNSTFGDPI